MIRETTSRADDLSHVGEVRSIISFTANAAELS